MAENLVVSLELTPSRASTRKIRRVVGLDSDQPTISLPTEDISVPCCCQAGTDQLMSLNSGGPPKRLVGQRSVSGRRPPDRAALRLPAACMARHYVQSSSHRILPAAPAGAPRAKRWPVGRSIKNLSTTASYMSSAARSGQY